MAYNTAKQIATIIKDTLAAELPTALTGASLLDFEEYRVGSPADPDKRILGVYMAPEKYTVNERLVIMVVHVQIPGILDFDQNYHSVIWDTILKNITPGLVGMENIDDFTADPFPVEPRDSSTMNMYVLSFTSSLDDCDFFE